LDRHATPDLPTRYPISTDDEVKWERCGAASGDRHSAVRPLVLGSPRGLANRRNLGQRGPLGNTWPAILDRAECGSRSSCNFLRISRLPQLARSLGKPRSPPAARDMISRDVKEPFARPSGPFPHCLREGEAGPTTRHSSRADTPASIPMVIRSEAGGLFGDEGC
jgi:hypothetical protein